MEGLPVSEKSNRLGSCLYKVLIFLSRLSQDPEQFSNKSRFQGLADAAGGNAEKGKFRLSSPLHSQTSNKSFSTS